MKTGRPQKRKKNPETLAKEQLKKESQLTIEGASHVTLNAYTAVVLVRTNLLLLYISASLYSISQLSKFSHLVL